MKEIQFVKNIKSMSNSKFVFEGDMKMDDFGKKFG